MKLVDFQKIIDGRPEGFGVSVDGVLDVRTVERTENLSAVVRLVALGVPIPSPTCCRIGCDCYVQQLAKIEPSAKIVALRIIVMGRR